MPTFLFWNLAGKPLESLVSELAKAHEADLLVLAECDVEPSVLLQALNRTKPEFQFAIGFSEKLRVFTRFHAGFLKPMFESSRVSIRRLRLPGRNEILLAAAHFPSKLYYSEETIKFESIDLARRIEDVESAVGHRRTVLMGDLNMNPFEAGLVAAGALNSVLSRDVALRESRTIQGKEYRFFYNPMWQHFGDGLDRPQGTFYYERADQINYYWNLFDQVLLRPDLLENFSASQVRILTYAGSIPLLDSKGRPDKKVASDHLPVLLTLEF